MSGRTPSILALDLSLTCCGWASTERGSGTFAPTAKGMERLGIVLDTLVQICAFHADLVLIEGYAFAARGRAVFSIGELGGVVRYALYDSELPYVDIPPSNLKKFATGKGNASKDLVLVEAVKRLGYEGSSNDEADALWMLAMARVHYGLDGAPDLPKAHLAALDKIQWPELS